MITLITITTMITMKNNEFENLRIVDNFYQTSSFFPMPVVGISTLSEDGHTNVGPYSLIFPYYIAGKNDYAMVLMVRNNSNTARNLIRTKKCALNFVSDDKKYMKECVRLGFPGDSTVDKMKNTIFTLTDGLRREEYPKQNFPKIIKESFQVFECTWLDNLEGADKFTVQEEYFPPFNDFNGITSKMGAHFILKIDRILIKSKYKKAILGGVKKGNFPHIPVDYGYRDNVNFWIADFKKPYAENTPKRKGNEISAVLYAADRIDPDVKFTEEACEKLISVPRIFLNTALKGCVEWAKVNGESLVTGDHMALIRDKRATEKTVLVPID